MKVAATFEDFLKLPNFFYNTIGIEPYRKENVCKLKACLASLTFYVGFINMNYALCSEILFVIMALIRQENFLKATMIMSYIGFVLMGSFKMFYIYKRKEDLTKFIRDLQQIFPRSLELQLDYNLRHYLQQSCRITRSFAGLYMILIWTYNLFNIIQYFVCELWLGIRQEGQTLPYLMYIPWNWRNHWSYYCLYAAQNLAGYTSAVGQIASDLLLAACATQLIMHYDFVAEKLVTYKVKGDFLEDYVFLSDLVRYHSNLLDLSAQLNNIFGVPLLLNFVTSSFVICFVGFQITIGAAPEVVLKLILFLVSSIAQVYLICHYGQQLMESSSNVAQAGYQHSWFKADIRCRKMLVFIAQRAQKPATLKATSFLPVSRETMTQIMQLSYKFFALLRTIYGEK